MTLIRKNYESFTITFGKTEDGWFEDPAKQEEHQERSLQEDIGPDLSPVDGF
jgi:hypothetical protein